MSQENVELARRGMKSAQAFSALFDERIVFNMRLVPDADDVYVGREAAIDASRKYWGTFEVPTTHHGCVTRSNAGPDSTAPPPAAGYKATPPANKHTN